MPLGDGRSKSSPCSVSENKSESSGVNVISFNKPCSWGSSCGKKQEKKESISPGFASHVQKLRQWNTGRKKQCSFSRRKSFPLLGNFQYQKQYLLEWWLGPAPKVMLLARQFWWIPVPVDALSSSIFISQVSWTIGNSDNCQSSTNPVIINKNFDSSPQPPLSLMSLFQYNFINIQSQQKFETRIIKKTKSKHSVILRKYTSWSFSH